MSVQTPARAPERRAAAERLTLTHPTRAYAVTHNPFAIPAILPLLAVCFIAVEVAVLLNADTLPIAGGIAILGAGLMLISAVNLKGSLTLTHDGVSFVQGKRQLTAPWENITGVVSRPDCGVCLEIANPEMDVEKFSSPGGLYATRGENAQIPLRYFGDRQYSILYDIRERLPEDRWKAVLDKASRRSPRMILLVYGLTVAISGLAMFAVMYAVTH